MAAVSLFFLLLSCCFGFGVQGQNPLSGRWTGFNGFVKSAIYDNYLITQTTATSFTVVCLDGPEPNAQPSSVCGWSNGTATISGGQVSMVLDGKTTLSGPLQSSGTCGWTQVEPTCPFSTTQCENIGRSPDQPENCTLIYWDNNTTWVMLRQFDTVHMVFMNHLDVGYNGIPLTGFINNILNIYFTEYFPRAASVAETLRIENGSARLIYTTHPWLVSLYLDCPENFVLAGIKLQCPSPEDVAYFEQAIQRGDITWHRGPFNLQPENAEPSLFEFSLSVAADLDAKFGFPTKKTLSQRDVPGMTRSVVPLLVKNGVEALSIGVNGYSVPALVNKAFVWQDLYSNTSVLALIHPYGYPNNPGTPTAPGGLSRSDCVTVPGFNQALCWAFRTDNSGPPMDVSEVFGNFQTAQTQYPGANIIASTFDNFVDELMSMRDSLPVVTSEIGDVWINGISSDPLKQAQYRALMRARVSCLAAGDCSLDDYAMKNSSRFLIKPGEHTWGLPSVSDSSEGVAWSNAAFDLVANRSGYTDCDAAWEEQRVFNDLAIQALGPTHPMLPYIERELAPLTPSLPQPAQDGFTQITNLAETFTCGNFSLQFDEQGALGHLVFIPSSLELASSSNPLGTLVYTTYSEADYNTNFGNAVFGGKPGADQFGHAVSANWLPTVNELWQKIDGDGTCEFLVSSTMLPNTVSNYGAPAQIWTNYTVLPTSILMTHQWFGKTSTRLPESFMMTFTPPPIPEYQWWMDKLGTPVSPVDTVFGGNPLQHAVWSGVSYQSPHTSDMIQFLSPDVALVSPITSDSNTPTPLLPFVSPLPGPVEGFGFNIYNNIWNTNYIFWYPFAGSEDADLVTRYAIAVVTADM